MAAQACRTVLLHIPRDQAAQAALVLSRYLRIPVSDEEKKHPAERAVLFGDAIAACRNARPLYEMAYSRWKSTIEQPSHAVFEAQVSGRLIVGLGGENVLETGLTLHHVYGTPLIPGSALKGLTAHYCAQAWGSRDAVFKPDGECYQALFGTIEDSGHIVFHDAWITPQSLSGENRGLARDVMTPHHADYYGAKPADRAPADWEMPNPVSFLAVNGRFLMAVSSDIADAELARQWCSLASTILTEALQHWGIGGKTNAGYGRMVRVTETAGAGVDAPARTPRFRAGEKVLVTRIADSKGREITWFQAEDGIRGRMRQNESPPQVEIGGKASLYVSSVTAGPDRNYVFSAQPVDVRPPTRDTSTKRRR